MDSLKRRISTIVMLSVILPMVFLAPFHHHDEIPRTELSCEDCMHHQPHPGHLGTNPGMDGCFLCQFLAQLFVPSTGRVLHLRASDVATVIRDSSDDVTLCFTRHSAPRAPPVSFLF